ncbi:hypothetical protein [Nitrospirillum pindoramense]|uniref:hypothetical protein n=1 Tax=Nitrospirillum amazonense TaxID=28077 RepID=UPI0011A1F783|nr:hypothetical protein [Nitrospirillum amazonense]
MEDLIHTARSSLSLFSEIYKTFFNERRTRALKELKAEKESYNISTDKDTPPYIKERWVSLNYKILISSEEKSLIDNCRFSAMAYKLRRRGAFYLEPHFLEDKFEVRLRGKAAKSKAIALAARDNFAFAALFFVISSVALFRLATGVDTQPILMGFCVAIGVIFASGFLEDFLQIRAAKMYVELISRKRIDKKQEI